jgi:DNA-binding GntR family transcriptional regulator
MPRAQPSVTDQLPPEPSGSPTRASTVYDRLRHDLLIGRLPPGHKLRVRQLMEQYDTGQTPLREALNRLTADGLVAFQDQRGFTVAPTSPAELAELTKTRCWLEELALRQAMLAATRTWEEALVLDCHRLLRTKRSLSEERYEENPEWEMLHRRFHRRLLEPCGSRPLRQFCDQLADRLYRYRQLSVRKIYPMRNINAEHEGILQAVLDGEADTAVKRLLQHYEATADIILQDEPYGSGG